MSKRFIANKRLNNPDYKAFDNKRNLDLYNCTKTLKEKLCKLDMTFPDVLTTEEKAKIHGALYKCRSKRYLTELILKFNI